MRRYFLSLILLLFVTQVSMAQGVRFEKGNWAAIQTKAKTENKFIFVDAVTATCGPCIWMAKKVFPKKEVGTFFNQHFINYKFDMEKGEGVAFAKKYKVQGFPTLLYFTPAGKLVHRNLGALTDTDLLREGQNTINPKKQYYTLRQQYEAGKLDASLMKNYIIALAWSGAADLEPKYFNQVVDVYLNKLGKTVWATKTHWKFIKQYLVNIDSKVFAYIVAHPQKFAQLGKPDELNQYITKVVGVSINQVVRSKEKDKLKNYQTHLKKIFGDKALPYMAEVTYKYYQRRKKATFAQARTYFDQYCNDEYELADGAKDIAQKYDTKDKLETALGWVNKSIKLEANATNTEVKGRILYKLKRYPEAKATIKQAILLAQKEKVDDSQLMKLLMEMED